MQFYLIVSQENKISCIVQSQRVRCLTAQGPKQAGQLLTITGLTNWYKKLSASSHFVLLVLTFVLRVRSQQLTKSDIITVSNLDF